MFLLFGNRMSAFHIIISDRAVFSTKDADNEMSRQISHAKTGNFCVRSQTFAWGNSTLQFELLNLDNNQVQVKELHLKEKFPYGSHTNDFGQVQAGQYQLTIRNLSSQALLIVDGCPGMYIYAPFCKYLP
jgi:hypothetical protein